ncbi:MAG: hypothetical protein Q8P18_20150 [Pseudomonadota bacterium]|nr:hypothetical protein [Pseudomonadota bacterium]
MSERENGAGGEQRAEHADIFEPAEAPPKGGPAARRLGGDEPLAEMFADLVGKLWRRGRVEMERAARKGRERLTLRQLRTDRDRMYQKLGKEARQLLEGGELDHPGLRRGVERIRELEAKLLQAEDDVRAVGGDPDTDAANPDGEGTGEEGGGSRTA